MSLNSISFADHFQTSGISVVICLNIFEKLSFIDAQPQKDSSYGELRCGVDLTQEFVCAY